MKKFFLMLTFVSVLFTACEEQQQQEEGLKEGAITLKVDHKVIKTDNKYAADLTVMLIDKSGVEQDITSEVEIYLEGEDLPLESSVFTTSTAGEYSFYAVYGFEISNTVTVKAVDGVVELPVDTDVSNTSFRQRMLLLQHTGTGCPNCPKLMTPLKNLAEDEDYNTLYHHVASHSYNDDDPAYTSDAAALSKVTNLKGFYPWLSYNLTSEYEEDYTAIRKSIDRLYEGSAEAGVSAATSLSGDSVHANVSLKAGKDGNYRLAVWLLEDSIRATQSNADASWQNMHENCLRIMYGESRTERIYGTNVGTLKAGESVDFIATFDLGTGWVGENCKVIVIAVSGDGDYELLTCAVCPVGETVGYEYSK